MPHRQNALRIEPETQKESATDPFRNVFELAAAVRARHNSNESEIVLLPKEEYACSRATD